MQTVLIEKYTWKAHVLRQILQKYTQWRGAQTAEGGGPRPAVRVTQAHADLCRLRSMAQCAGPASAVA